MSTRFEVRIDVDAPPGLVWSVVTDWPAQRDWIPATTVHVIAGDGRSTGSRIVAFSGLADIGVLDTMEITEWEPPRRCRVRHLGRLLRGTGEFAVEPRGAGSTFVWVEDLEPPFGPLGRVGLPLVRPLFEAGLRRGGPR
ncbi:MAG TPA: SRPBCC family protein, partial [Pseudonocardiaceae bacterium]